MNEYRYWIKEEGSLIIEKYEGHISIKEVLTNDGDILANVNFKTIYCLTDISSATLSNIEPNEIDQLLGSFEDHEFKVINMKLAIYKGDKDLSDNLKLLNYAKEDANRSFTIRIFRQLCPALQWLNLSKNLQTEVKALLDA